ncbi:hypothetical protein [Slackia isoflavoniconvertens]|uniref:Clostridial hydrophobic W n=1 Tax=Slackia isoflavoniconvertens TaxID=572010 RepID=A0A3N0IA26_9ACTN|nr:hypothetical protein [Slackia isoflavoniconvertens]MBB3280016.1 uncharacterized protein YjdB [Slackia isoflavoniconvertens]RNM33202.1 hypothetical protein DMP05_08900 [Slackia isoflavoniconvertens]
MLIRPVHVSLVWLLTIALTFFTPICAVAYGDEHISSTGSSQLESADVLTSDDSIDNDAIDSGEVNDSPLEQGSKNDSTGGGQLTPAESAADTMWTPSDSTSSAQGVPDVSYDAHVSNVGWQSVVSNGDIAGTVGQAKAIEALRIQSSNPNLDIQYSSHISNLGWEGDFSRSNNQVTGTMGRSLGLEAIKIRLSGALANSYDVYYRVHVANFGWLGWACNGNPAGSTGWAYHVEAIQIQLVNKGMAAPGDTTGAFIPSDILSALVNQVGQTTSCSLSWSDLASIKALGLADSVRVSGEMLYRGRVTRSVVFDSALDASELVVDFETYGPFDVSIDYIKDGTVKATQHEKVGIVADEYNLAPLSASFPVVLYSLAYWDISSLPDGDSIPSIVMLDRPSAYNWSSLPDGMYAMPFMTESENATSSDWSIFADYVAALHELNPDSKFHLYINDITCALIHRIIYANGIPDGNYSITLLSDGSATYVFTNKAFDISDPYAKESALISEWNAAKAAEYQSGAVSSNYSDYHDHWDSMHAVLTIEPGAEWWMTRTNLFTSGDNNAFANEIASNPAVKRKNVASMLSSLEGRGESAVSSLKTLYNFNDGYFNDAVAQGKKAMMFLGTYVYYEQNFKDYAQLTETYYGDNYLYYYKGHPNTPTGMYPEKQTQLDSLGITDVDSSVAAELILFFNPEIGLSGYGSSTYNSADASMAGGLWNMTKENALSPDSSIDYSVMDWFASPISDSSNAQYKELCADGDTCYLVEFSDEILASGEYDFAIYSRNSASISFYKKQPVGAPSIVKVNRGNTDVLSTAHVSEEGWLPSAKTGSIAGTTGKAEALEALKVEVQNAPYDGGIEYRSHVSGLGWESSWAKDGSVSGTTGQARSIEALQMRLYGDMADKYDLYYRVHCQNYGWLDWAKNGEVAGTTGYALRAESFEVRLVGKGEAAPGNTDEPAYRKSPVCQAHVANIGWQGELGPDSYIGTVGRGFAMEAFVASLSGMEYDGGIEYRAHVANIGWMDWSANGGVAGTTGRGLQMEAIKLRLTGDIAERYSIAYRAHVQDYGWLDWCCDGEEAGTTGRGLRLEAIQIKLVQKK